MDDSNYKNYSLQKLEEWMDDVMSSGEATPREIYDSIYKIVCENFFHHRRHMSQAHDLMNLLTGNDNHIQDSPHVVKRNH